MSFSPGDLATCDDSFLFVRFFSALPWSAGNVRNISRRSVVLLVSPYWDQGRHMWFVVTEDRCGWVFEAVLRPC